MKTCLKYFVYFLLLLIPISLLIDFIRISNYEVYPMLPTEKTSDRIKSIYFDLVNNKTEVEWDKLNITLDYVDSQYDVSDFRLATLIRILYEFPDQIPDNLMTRIKSSVLKFRYWMDEPGGNSMCYWSENHQILFASAEYLLGQLYPNEVFTNSGLTGIQHKQKAEIRINDWLEMKWQYGFTEFYSNVYYTEDIAGIINIIDYAENDSIATKAMIVMDLLLYDVAAQSIDNMFVSSSGRAYQRSRKGGAYAVLGGLTKYLWDSTPYTKGHMTYGVVISKKYQVPSVLIEIAKDADNVVIKQSNGMNIEELKTEGYFGTDERSMMMQWGMEAFTNSEIIRNTMSYIRKNNMFTNAFLNPISVIDFTILRMLHLEPALSTFLESPADGVALQRANTYTYKTKDYSLYTAQAYHPGYFADQHHISGMNIGNSFSIFHTHPAASASSKTKSPNYWVGYGRIPHAVQDSSVSIAIYNIPDKKGMMEKRLLNFTHAYFPKERFDTTIIIDNYAFGKIGNIYCVFIGKSKFTFAQNTTDDLIQEGKLSFWITEAGSLEKDDSFENFYNRILQNKILFDTKKITLNYSSNGNDYKLNYNGDFLINGSIINTDYSRYDSPYIKSKQNAESIVFNFNGKSLYLDFNQVKRNYN